MNTEPDGFMGAVLAAEGIEGMKALINGPGGCRSRAQILLKELIQNYSGEDPGCCSSKYFSRQSKLPCTYLSSNDMIMGSSEKVSDGVGSVLSVSESDIVMVDTLGASIQVMDTDNAVRRTGKGERVTIASKYLSSMSLYEGYDDNMERIIRDICPPEKTDMIPRTVNILGYNISDSGWEFGKEEISKIINGSGAEVISFIGCGSTKEEIERSRSAELNILIHPEFSIGTAEFYSREFDVPYIIPKSGSPIGYPSLMSFVNEVSSELGTDATNVVNEISKDRKSVDKTLNNAEKLLGGLRGCGCCITGIPSDILPIIRWMHDHLSIIPECVNVLGGKGSPLFGALIDYLEDIDCMESLDNDPGGVYDVVFTNGMMAGHHRELSSITTCVETTFPFSKGTSLVNRSLVGIHGCRYILDELINGRGLFHCGQPTMADFR